LRQRRLGAQALCLLRFDLPLRELEGCFRAPYRGLLLSQLRRELLRTFDGSGAFLRQILVARGLLLREREPRLRLLQLGSVGLDLRLLNDHLRIYGLHAGLRLLHRCLGLTHGDHVVGRINDHQQIALAHVLVINDVQFDDPARHLGSDHDDRGAHRCIARPWRRHIDARHGPTENPGCRGRRQGDQDGPDSRHERATLGGRPADDRSGRRNCGVALGYDLGDRHGNLRAAINTQDERMMM
jgi:hypothetical protein